MISDSLESLDCRSRCKISRPVSMRIACVWEKVIGFRWPSDVRFVKRLEITRRCRVEKIHFQTIFLTLISVPKQQKIRQREKCVLDCASRLIELIAHATFFLLYELIKVLEPNVCALEIEVFTHSD